MNQIPQHLTFLVDVARFSCVRNQQELCHLVTLGDVTEVVACAIMLIFPAKSLSITPGNMCELLLLMIKPMSP